MMPSRSTPNLQSQPPTPPTTSPSQSSTVYAYLQSPAPKRDDDSPPPAPPVRDSSSLKSIKYGPGHEKFPSWPVPAAADTPPLLKSASGGGSHRSKSWTDHTNYPKEKVVAYTRPYMRRQHSSYTQQKLKTVMERCEKIPPEMFESRYDHKLAPNNNRMYLPQVDRDGKPLGDMDYMVPSPPERDIGTKPPLTQADLEEYARSYQEPSMKFYDKSHLTESGLEEYTRNYEESLFSTKHDESILGHLHQKQLSYAQSEGYHSYVSSTDSTSTPFLDRLRRDSEAASHSQTWEGPQVLRNEGRDSVVTTSSGSASSSETLKWHGSMSDVSVASSNSTHPANAASRQLIVHSARVQTPQRHHSESVLYMSSNDNPDGWKDKEIKNNTVNKFKLFPVNTYTVQDYEHPASGKGSRNTSTSKPSATSVAERISELEKQHKYSYLDPNKKHKIPDPTLKAIQKKALLSFYERHHTSNKNNSQWRSEPQLSKQVPTAAVQPQPPPRLKLQLPSRRASCASDYASGTNSRRSSLTIRESKTTDSLTTNGGRVTPRHQHSNSCGSLATDLLGPVIVGPSISVDDWVPDRPPERPPKNPNLRTVFPDLFQRVPSPDLPPPSPPTVFEDEVFNSDEPLPPPPPDLESDWQKEFNERLKENQHVSAAPQAPKKCSDSGNSKVPEQTVGLPETGRFNGVRSSIRTRPGDKIFQQVSSRPYHAVAVEKIRQDERQPDFCLAFPNQRGYAERSSTRYPSQKLINGNVATSQKVVNGISDQYRAEPLKPQRASIAESPTSREAPPPLQPRQIRINQSMRVKGSHDRSGPILLGNKEDRMRESRSHSMSQSKASYLASRRDKDRIVPDSETGSYKRTMSPNGHAITPEEPQKLKEPWPTTNIVRRSSMKDKAGKTGDRPDAAKTDVVLPDVLPVNAKILNARSQHYRPTSLSLKPVEGTPPPSPKYASRGSPLSPLRSTHLSNPPTPVSPPPPTQPAPASPSTTTSSSPLQVSPLTSPEMSPPRSPAASDDRPKVIEGLQLIQRTEVVLRVNTSTTDASSQTDKEELPVTPLPVRRKLQEEIECEKLSEDFVNHLPTSDRLKELLVPGPDHKKPTDYVQGLFKVEVTSRPRPLNSPFRSRNNTPSTSPLPNSVTNKSCSPPVFPKEPSSPLSGTSTYFTTSEPKAKFLTRYSQDMNQCHVVKDTKDLRQKKEELVNRLDRKLQVLRSEQLVVSEECKINDELGVNVETHINRLARPHEAAKFRLHIEEVGKITSLLLGLSGRLARAENALMGMPDDHPEKRILESKRDKLLEQLEEAKKLKECIDRRSVSVSNILNKYLNNDEYTDYDHFINMKAKLIMDSKEIADKIKLGEEQLSALKETLIVSD